MSFTADSLKERWKKMDEIVNLLRYIRTDIWLMAIAVWLMLLCKDMGGHKK